uniref:PARP-type domain-containing protein n=1 Tax=Corethron hystrix TaxID=216773 RepID=A0A7S1B6B7_9STRA|mmetsp:Transcript_1443/g.3008  ORF Transcript_1443/g.3008 Transcript_1443/m.3008 type:complete len:468 (+) Transcript_1443:213-1616(+)
MTNAKYHIEKAKSGRATCKKCKLKIGKGEIRIGETRKGEDFDMVSWKHAKCFTMGRKLVASTSPPLTVEKFLEDVIGDPDNLLEDEDMFKTVLGDMLDAKSSGVGKRKRALVRDVTDGDTGIMDVAREIYAKLKKSQRIEPKKKRKKRNDDGEEEEDTSEDATEAIRNEVQSLSDSDRKIVEYFIFYNDMTSDELKSFLRWNFQMLSGTKDILVERCVDGEQNGRLGTCPTCEGGRIKLREGAEKVYCNGYYDEDVGSRISCFYEDDVVNAARELPWFMEEPSEEVIEAITTARKNPNLAKNESAVEESSSSFANLALDLKSKVGVKKAASQILEICRAKNVDLPDDEKKATVRIGRILVQNKSIISGKEIFKIIVSEFGLKQSKEEKFKAKKSAGEGCEVAENGPLFLAIKELSDLYFKAIYFYRREIQMPEIHTEECLRQFELFPSRLLQIMQRVSVRERRKLQA